MNGPILKSRVTLTSCAMAALLLAVFAGRVTAAEIQVKLSGDQEVPPVQTSASGSGSVTVEDDKSIKGKIITDGIKGNGAHIHEGAVGKNGPDIITLKKTGDKPSKRPGIMNGRPRLMPS